MQDRNILITGSEGFIGKNLYYRLKESGFTQIYGWDKQNSIAELYDYLTKANTVFHLAGVNRPENISEFDEINSGLTATIVHYLVKIKKTPQIIFSSSTQVALDNPYGKSKRGAEELLKRYSEETGATVTVYRLTNVFGKWSRPNYNSVVSTFCHNIANGLSIEIHDKNKELELVYIDDVVKSFVSQLANIKKNGFIIKTGEPTYSITLGQLAELVTSLRNSRHDLVLSDFSDPFIKKLNSTFLSYLPEHNNFPITKEDNRGKLTELLKSKHIGQIFISTTKEGVIRGNHYHHTKVEKFCVIKGNAFISLRKIDSDSIIKYNVSGKKIEIVDIPPGYTHNIENIGKDEMICLFWASEIFDPENTDTYFLKV